MKLNRSLRYALVECIDDYISANNSPVDMSPWSEVRPLYWALRAKVHEPLSAFFPDLPRFDDGK